MCTRRVRFRDRKRMASREEDDSEEEYQFGVDDA